MPRKLRADMEPYEMRGALVYTARKPRPCDVAGCGAEIRAGITYALISTNVAVCNQHWEPADIEEAS